MKGQNRAIRVQERIDMNLANELREISKKRLINGIEEETIPLAEITRMIPNTVSWELVKKELETKERRKYNEK